MTLGLRARLCRGRLDVVKKLAALALPVFMLALPAVASACPASKRSSSCGGSALGEYTSTFGIGLLVGVGSVAVESALRRRKKP